MTKRLHVFLFILIAILCTSIAIPVQAQDLAWTGAGTAESPYQVSSQEHLAAIPTQGVSHYYKLTKDITLSGAWEPTCNEKAPFTGTFDGAGYCISGLNVNMNQSDHTYVGLFEYIDEGGVVKNLAVKGKVVASGKSTYAGGIVGLNKGTIQNCYTDVSVTAPAAGGIAGSNKGTITSCYTVGDNSGAAYYAGGIAGDNYKTIEKCYATGAVNGKSAGGIVGKNIIQKTPSITNCIALNSSITGTNIRRIGYETATYTGNYASPAIAGTWSDIGADKENGADLDAANFTNVKEASGAFTGWPTGDDGWDLTTDNLPTLKSIKGTQPAASTTRKSVMPVTIGTANELANFRNAVNDGQDYKGKTVKLTNNITGNMTTTGIRNFAGTFDGCGYVITMTNVTASLFHSIAEGGTVKNLGVNATINTSASYNYGGIAMTNSGTIQQCYAIGSITGTNAWGGGIVGTNEGAIRDCYSTVSITVNAGAGGIAQVNNGTIERCYATGAIGKSGSTSGIAGDNKSSITNCIALNTSFEGTGLGRIVGSNTGTLTGNYASPAIPGTWNNKEADQIDGADLDDNNFTGKGAGEGAFANWSGDNWEFGDNTNLPTLKGFKAAQPVASTTRKSVISAISSIATADDLKAFRDAVKAGETYEGDTVKLTKDITVTDWIEGIARTKFFKGTFDGQGYVINLTGSTSLFYQIGEYGSSEGTVQNLGVNATITITSNGSSYGSIAMTNYGIIQQCYAEGSITGGNTYAGGIVGTNESSSSTIRDCYSTVAITVNQGAGGIVQVNRNLATIERCYATGAISGGGNDGVGGIAGDNDGSSKIRYCIALNASTTHAGTGNLGRITGTNKGTLTTNYASPLIAGTWNNKEAGKIDGADLDNDNFTGKGDNEGAFTGWLATAWDFGDKTKLPILIGFKGTQSVASITRKSKLPAITSIATEADLIAFRDTVNGGANYTGKTVTLTADITLTGDWTPIGSFENLFNGTFEGGGHCISGLSVTINKDGDQYGGLFFTIGTKGIVQDLGLKGTVSVTSGNASVCAGGITGQNLGTIQNCYTNVTVTASTGNPLISYDFAGGIAGMNNSKISNCYTMGNSTAVMNAGGIAGSNMNTIEQCYATGAVEATHTGIGSAGGIAGYSFDGSSCTNCIALNSSIITGEYSGRISGNSDGTFTDNYASPVIVGTWKNKGDDKKDGADLDEDNFINKVLGASAFDGWLPAVWDFSDADKLPKLKTTGLATNIVIAGQDPMPARSAFLETDIKISTAVAYDAATHKGKSILVESTGIFTIDAADASLKKLTIKDSGQVVATKAFQCSQLLAPRTLGNRWTAYSSPVEMKAVAKEGTKFYTKTGYKTPSEKDQKWSYTGDNDLISTPCSLTSPTLVSVNGKSDVKIDVTFTATPAEGSTSLTIPAEGTATTGSALSTGIFVFCQNPTLKNITIPVAYILSADGKRFERTAGAIVKPFEAYMVANAATSAAVMSLRAGDSATSNDKVPLPDNSFRLWGSNGQLHLSADKASEVTIYDLSGRLIHRFPLTGERTLNLGRGIYLVRNNNITYKVSL